MAFYDIVQSGGIMSFDRVNVGAFVDIVSGKSELYFPLITPGGGGGGFSVLSSPIIKAIIVGR